MDKGWGGRKVREGDRTPRPSIPIIDSPSTKSVWVHSRKAHEKKKKIRRPGTKRECSNGKARRSMNEGRNRWQKKQTKGGHPQEGEPCKGQGGGTTSVRRKAKGVFGGTGEISEAKPRKKVPRRQQMAKSAAGGEGKCRLLCMTQGAEGTNASRGGKSVIGRGEGEKVKSNFQPESGPRKMKRGGSKSSKKSVLLREAMKKQLWGGEQKNSPSVGGGCKGGELPWGFLH